MNMKKYIIWFDFPFGKTYYRNSYIDTSYTAGNLEIPEFSADKTLAKEFKSKEDALRIGRFFAGKYSYGVDEI